VQFSKMPVREKKKDPGNGFGRKKKTRKSISRHLEEQVNFQTFTSNLMRSRPSIFRKGKVKDRTRGTGKIEKFDWNLGKRTNRAPPFDAWCLLKKEGSKREGTN